MANDLSDIRFHLSDELTPDPRARGKYLCPLCGSGSHAGSSHDGAFSIDKDKVHGKCFSCRWYGDIFDLVSARDGISLQEATKTLVAKYGTSSTRMPSASARKAAPAPDPQPQPQKDYRGYCESCRDAMKGSPGEEYLHGRGFDDAMIAHFMLGYDPSHYFPGRGAFPAIVFPYDARGDYVGWRSITEKHYDKPKTAEAGKEPVYNVAALYSGDPVFVVESQLCAISITQAGGRAVAIGGSGESKLLRQIESKAPSNVLILSLDNDEPGQAAQQKLSEELSNRNILHLDFVISGDCKDPNELLQKDPEALRDNISAAVVTAATLKAGAQELEEEKKAEQAGAYRAMTTAGSFQDFDDYLAANANRPPIPTGFPSLDGVLNGGLCAGLYIMGAISSLGKTSWMLNIADNIATSGRDVLYFSLEMSRYELMAKSISRFSFLNASNQNRSTGEAFTTFEVLNSSQFVAMDSNQRSALHNAMDLYRRTAGQHMWIFDGISTIGPEDIRQRVEEHIRITGNRPVVFIDYLQILAPADPHMSDKQNTDQAVVNLKRVSSAYDVPIFCISSLNRANYKEAISMAAFKESGAIEYGSDVLIGLQLYGIRRDPGEKDKQYADRILKLIEKAEKDPQVEIEVRVLKNRNGQRYGSGKLLFNKKYNSFTDVPERFSVVPDNPFADDEEETPKPIHL